MQVLKLWRLPYAALISLAEDVVRGAFVRVDFQRISDVVFTARARYAHPDIFCSSSIDRR